MHAAALVRTARTLLPDCRFGGLTGPRMRDAGVESIGDLTAHAAMLTGIASIRARAKQLAGEVERSWDERRPDLVVLMDSSVFHLPLAARAKSRGLRVLYYIAPQTWASRAFRNRRIASCVKKVACILPFEQQYFRARGVDADYVGHPLFEHLRDETPDDELVARLRGEGGPLLALLPGSRAHVISEVLPLQLAVIRLLRADGVKIAAAVSCASPQYHEQIRGLIAASGTPARIAVDGNASLLTACDLALVASGTATLHAGHYRKPMVVMYNAAAALRPLHAVLGGLLLTTPHLSLINILAAARVVPEFMPFVRDVQAVARVAGALLSDESWRSLMVRQIDQTIAPLEDSRASERVCGIISGMLGERARGVDTGAANTAPTSR